jgi:26S proteasome regulatory subunit N2
MAMVYQQISEARSPASKKFRESLISIVNDKHQTNMSKSGAILAAGIIDAGGRNVLVGMQSRTGFMKMGCSVGVMMFLQYWYWYPLKLFLSLSFNPTVLIGLNKDFDMPNNFEVICQAPPSMFAYPKIDEKKEDEKKLVATAVLSTTVRAKAREARKEARKKSTTMDTSSADAGDAAIPGPIPMERVKSHLSTVSYLSIEVS